MTTRQFGYDREELERARKNREMVKNKDCIEFWQWYERAVQGIPMSTKVMPSWVKVGALHGVRSNQDARKHIELEED